MIFHQSFVRFHDACLTKIRISFIHLMRFKIMCRSGNEQFKMTYVITFNVMEFCEREFLECKIASLLGNTSVRLPTMLLTHLRKIGVDKILLRFTLRVKVKFARSYSHDRDKS